MTTLARLIAFLLSLAVLACSFLPWVGTANAWDLPLRSLVSPGRGTGSALVTSIGLGLTVAAVILLLGSLLNSRALIILGGLVTVALPSIWILSNAVARSTGIPMSRIQVGAYGAVVMGFVALVLAAVATDTRLPTAR
jgi:hypothetical protein